MSMHEWYSIMYGIEFPYVKADGNKVLNFIENHKKHFEGEDYLPKTVEEAAEYAEEFECDEGAYGLAALISFVADNKYIYAEHDDSGNDYIGMFANSLFPWDTPSDDWSNVNREELENEIRSLVEELGIECPEFDEHQVWYFG